MQKSETRQAAKIAHRQMRVSTTLNRKYVKRPTKMMKKTAKQTAEDTTLTVQVKTKKQQTSPRISHFNTTMATAQMTAKEKDTEKMMPAK